MLIKKGEAMDEHKIKIVDCDGVGRIYVDGKDLENVKRAILTGDF